MDFSKIGDQFPKDKLTKPASSQKGEKKDSAEGTKSKAELTQKSLGSSLMKLSSQQFVKRLNELLSKTKDPQIKELFAEFKLNRDNRQMLALTAYSCIKKLMGKNFTLSEEEENLVFQAIEEEHEEDRKVQTMDPEEKKKKKNERKKKNKKKVNLLINLVEASLETLEKNYFSEGSLDIKT